jgi:hypothetical protein
MKRHSSLASLCLALALLFGAAFKCGSDNRPIGGDGPSINGGPPAPSSGDLKVGEYACYGFGGQLLIGLGFKVLPGNRYTDLDNRDSGTFSIEDDVIRFHGGHLDGQFGRYLGNNKLTIRTASCAPFK